MEIIVSKWNWDAVKSGSMSKLEIHKTENLHHVFGDDPEKYIVKLRIEEVGKDSEDQEKGENKWNRERSY